jgi:hypothetical protein
MAGKTKTERQFAAGARKLERLHKGINDKVPSGLRMIGEEIMLDSKASRPGKGVPVDKGILRASGRVEGPMDDEVHLSYGGAAAPYALVQHEDTSLHHNIGEARYLTRAVERWSPNGASARAALAELKKVVDKIAAERATANWWSGR